MKSNKCFCCNKSLKNGDAIYADKNGNLSVYGKPYCNDCLPVPKDLEDEVTDDESDS